MTTFVARISINEYILLSVYDVASKFSAHCARTSSEEEHNVTLETIGVYFQNVYQQSTPLDTKIKSIKKRTYSSYIRQLRPGD